MLRSGGIPDNLNEFIRKFGPDHGLYDTLENLFTIKTLLELIANNSVPPGKYIRVIKGGVYSFSIPEVGDVFQDRAFWSTSKDDYVVQQFIKSDRKVHAMILTIEVGLKIDGSHWNGLDFTRGQSRNEGDRTKTYISQQEVLLPPGSKVRILNIQKEGENLYRAEGKLVE